MHSYSFGEFALDTSTRQLLRGGQPAHLPPKAFQLLQALVEAAPRALSKVELQERLWPDTFVVEANLQHLIVDIRAALGDDPRRPRYVRTVHGFGYAFQEVPVGADRREPGGPVCRLRWDAGRATLSAGEHLIGRDPAGDVTLDSAAVSRVHARIRVSADQVTLEDLGSKNGSFVGSRRVEGRVALTDGDQISIGTIPIVVRISPDAASTETAVGPTGSSRARAQS